MTNFCPRERQRCGVEGAAFCACCEGGISLFPPVPSVAARRVRRSMPGRLYPSSSLPPQGPRAVERGLRADKATAASELAPANRNQLDAGPPLLAQRFGDTVCGHGGSQTAGLEAAMTPTTGHNRAPSQRSDDRLFLSRAGMKSRWIEANERIGGGCSTEERIAPATSSSARQFRHVWALPAAQDLDLARYDGAFLISSHRCNSRRVFPRRPGITVHKDLDKPARSLARFSKQDDTDHQKFLRNSGTTYCLENANRCWWR